MDRIDKRLDRIEENQKALDKLDGIERQISERWERPVEQKGGYSDMLEAISKRYDNIISFLSDPSPIIGCACHSLPN